MAYATVADVQARANWPLTDAEKTLAGQLLDDAEGKIRARVPGLDARVAADAEYKKLVIRIEADAVLRVLRNPEGYREEADGDYSYGRMAAVAAGYLLILDDDWRDLGVNQGAFTITPVVRRPCWGLRDRPGWWPGRDRWRRL